MSQKVTVLLEQMLVQQFWDRADVVRQGEAHTTPWSTFNCCWNGKPTTRINSSTLDMVDYPRLCILQTTGCKCRYKRFTVWVNYPCVHASTGTQKVNVYAREPAATGPCEAARCGSRVCFIESRGRRLRCHSPLLGKLCLTTAAFPYMG